MIETQPTGEEREAETALAKILIVDDEEPVANSVCELLREEGYTARAVTDPRKAIAGERHIPLTPTEFKLLRTLAQEPGRVFTRDDLLTTVWGYEPGSDTRLVDVHVGRLRKKLQDADVAEVTIETSRGFGYRLTQKPA